MSDNNVLSLLNEFLGGDLQKQAMDEASGDTQQKEPESGDTQAASEGERSSENSSDVKAEQPGTSVDEAADNTNEPAGTGANTATNKIGISATETGKEVPAVSTTCTDPGTSHPAKSGTEKYSSATSAELVEGGNDLLADIAVLAKQAMSNKPNLGLDAVAAGDQDAKEATESESEEVMDDTASGDVKVTDKEAASKTDEASEMQEKAAAFDELIGYITGQSVASEMNEELPQEKTAEDVEFEKTAAAEAYRLYNHAGNQATELVDFLTGFEKASMGEVDPALLEQMAGGAEEEAMPMEPGMEEGGMPPELMGGDPGMEEGGMAGGAEEIDPALLEQLIALLQEQGLGGGGGEVAPEGGAPGGAEELAEGEPEAEVAAPGLGEETSEEGGEEMPYPEKEASVNAKALATALIEEIKAREAK